MCLAFFAVRTLPEICLLVAFNRDKAYERQTKKAHWWEDHPRILAGRDLQRGGTWAGVTKEGKVAFLTFVRNGERGIPSPRFSWNAGCGFSSQ